MVQQISLRVEWRAAITAYFVGSIRKNGCRALSVHYRGVGAALSDWCTHQLIVCQAMWRMMVRGPRTGPCNRRALPCHRRSLRRTGDRPASDRRWAAVADGGPPSIRRRPVARVWLRGWFVLGTTDACMPTLPPPPRPARFSIHSSPINNPYLPLRSRPGFFICPNKQTCIVTTSTLHGVNYYRARTQLAIYPLSRPQLFSYLQIWWVVSRRCFACRHPGLQWSSSPILACKAKRQ